jgi:transcriptional regulator with XRE-family HTH domain
MSKAKTPGEILKEARLKKGWTQDELAKKAGLGKNTYPKIERDISKPSPESIKRLVKVLGIDPSKIPHLLG